MQHHAERAWEQMIDAQDGRTAAIPTGLTGLDGDDEQPGLLGGGLHPGELVVVAADQAGGKTTFALQALLHAAKRGAQVLLLSQEMNGSDIFTRFECSEARVPLDRLRAGKLTHDEIQSLGQAAKSLAELPIRICDTGSASVSDIRNAALVARARGGVGLVVVDYLQILEPLASSRDARPHEIIDANTRALKVLAREISAPVLLLSQFNRASQAERRSPRIQDLKGSGGIESHADVVMVLHPAEGRQGGPAPDEVPTELMVLKNRSGPTGTVRLMFERRHLRFRAAT